MKTNPDVPEDGGTCPNCSAELSGPYCAECGQLQLDLDRPFREIGAEAMEAFLSFDTRIVRTLWPLVSRPGFLTLEFMAGRRARYVHPFKLYFAICVILFIGLASSGYSVIVIGNSDDTGVAIGGTAEGEATGREEEHSPEKGEALEEAAPARDPSVLLAESDDESSFFFRLFQPLGELAETDPKRLDRLFSDRLANSIIILVPVFALLLRMLYWRRNYITQLVFSLHVHSFAFLALLVGLGLDLVTGVSERSDPGNAAAVVAIAVYTFLALRRVQGQGKLVTIAKMVLLFVGYLVALIITMMLTLALTALTL